MDKSLYLPPSKVVNNESSKLISKIHNKCNVKRRLHQKEIASGNSKHKSAVSLRLLLNSATLLHYAAEYFASDIRKS